jgi:hypothetical protein
VKKRILRFDSFLVWTFNMNKGDLKTTSWGELNGGLEPTTDMVKQATHKGVAVEDVQPLLCCTLFVRGSFLLHKSNKPPVLLHAGEAGYGFTNSEKSAPVTIEAMEDDCEYHCMVPRSKEPIFWQRKGFDAAQELLELPLRENQFIYLAKGQASCGSSVISDRSMFDLSGRSATVKLEDAIGVILWR